MLAVLGIVLAIALPNFRQYLVRSRVLGPVRDIERTTSMVRLRGINAQRPGVLVFVEAGKAYADLASGPAARYLGGNAVVGYVDQDNSGSFSSGDQLVAGYVLPRALGFRRPGSGDPVPSGGTVVYTPSGNLSNVAGERVYLGDGLGNYMRLVFTGSGSVKREKNVPGTADEWIGPEREGEWRWVY